MKIDIGPMEEEPKGILDVDSLMAEGWQIQDHPQMLIPYWRFILKGYGEEGKDYHKLTEATYESEKDGKPAIYMRGQLLLGPNARSNLKNFWETNKIPEV